MRQDMKQTISDAKRKTNRRRKLYAAVAVCSVLVAGFVSWKLVLPGVAMGGDTYCGKEEHAHTAECYEQVLVCGQEEGAEAHTHTEDCYTVIRTDELICGQEESAGHVHSETCYDPDGNLICGQEEGAGAHAHTDECYATERQLTCGLEEGAGHVHSDACYQQQMTCGRQEHTHTLACYSDPNAVETEAQWTEAFRDYERTGNWGEDTAAIAKTQVGYTESEDNYRVNEDGTTDGYTRYGDWAGDPYGDWDLDFAAFCLIHAGVPTNQFPVSANDLGEWTKALSDSGYYAAPTEATPQPGDLAVLEKDGQDRAQQMGIVSRVETDRNGNAVSVRIIEGNADDTVKETAYRADDEDIAAYGLLSRAYAEYSDAEEEETAGDNGSTLEEDGGQNIPAAAKQAVNLLENNGGSGTGGDVTQRVTVNITPKDGGTTTTGQELGVSVNATYSGANWEGEAEIWIRLGEMPEGMRLAGFINGEHTVAVNDNYSIVLKQVEEAGISYVVFDLPAQGNTVMFDLDFATENGIMPEKTTLNVAVDTGKTTIGEDPWVEGLDHASASVDLTWTADFDWDDVVKKVNDKTSNTIKYYEDENRLSGTLIYTISAMGNNHDTYGAIWTDHIEITDSLELTGGKMWFPENAAIDKSTGKITTTDAEGKTVDLAWFENDQNCTVENMEWVTEGGKRVGVTYTLRINNQNWNSTGRDHEQTNLNLELRVNSQYLKLTEDFGKTFSDEKDRITNAVDFTAVPCVEGVNPETSKDDVFTTLEKTNEEGRLTKTVAGADGEKPDRVEEGDVLTYTISFENIGHTPIALKDENGQPYRVTDELPVYLILTSEQEAALKQAGAEASYNSQTKRWTITWDPIKTVGEDTLDTGEKFTFVFAVTVKEGSGESLNDNAAITNTASYKGFSGQSTVYFGEGKIKVEKTSNKNTVANGDEVTYTITISNTGGADIETEQTFTDILPNGLEFVSAAIGNNGNINGNGEYSITSTSQNQYTVDFSKADKALTWTLNQLKKGDSVFFTYTCRVNTDEMDGTEVLTNTINHDGDEGEDKVTIGVNYPLELEKIVQQDTSKVYESESEFDYTITLKNDPYHPSQQDHFELVDTLPEGMIPIGYTLTRTENEESKTVFWEEFAKEDYLLGNATFATQINGDTVSVSKAGNQIVLTWHIEGEINNYIQKTYRAKLILSSDQMDGEVYDFKNTVRMDELEDSVTVHGGEGCTLLINKNIYFADPDYQNGEEPGFIGELDGQGLDSQAAIESAQKLSFEITGKDKNGNTIEFEDDQTKLTIPYMNTGCDQKEDTFYSIGTTLEPGTYTIKEVFPDMANTGYELDSSEYMVEGDTIYKDYPEGGIQVTIENGQAKSVSMNNTYRPEGEASIDIQKSVFGIAEKNGDQISPISSKDEISAEPGTGEYLISYHISVINTGKRDVIIEEITDTLPEGMEYVGMANNASSMFRGDDVNDSISLQSGSQGLLTSAWGRTGGTIEKSNDSSKNKIIFKTIGNSYVESVQNSYMILEPSGEQDSIVSFLMICSIDAENLQENVALTNTVSVAARSDSGDPVLYRDCEDISSKNTPYDAIQNIGSSEDMGTQKKGDYEYRVVSSSVSIMPTKQMVPGIKKEAVAYGRYDPESKDSIQFENIDPETGIIEYSNAMIKWKVTIYNDGTLDMKNYTISDVMTDPFQLLMLSNGDDQLKNYGIKDQLHMTKYTFQSGGGYTSQTMILSNDWIGPHESEDNSGQNGYDITIPSGAPDHYTIKPGEYAELTLYTYCKETNYKTYMNTATIKPKLTDDQGNPVEFNALRVQDGRGEVVYGEDGNPIGVKASDNVYAMGAYGSRSWKEVEERDNSENHGDGSSSGGTQNYIQVGAADGVIYRNNIQNVSQTSFKDMVIIDRLPEEGDIGVVNSMDQRGSQFKVSWAEGLELYKTDSKGTRTRLSAENYKVEFSDHPVDQAFSDDDFTEDSEENWHSSWNPGDTSFRIVMAPGFRLKSNETLIIQYNGKIADDAGSLEIAWNSFGYRYTADEDGAPILTAEPPKVGVMIEESYELPETGGIGTTGFFTGGAILMAASCLAGGYRMRRKRERGDR